MKAHHTHHPARQEALDWLSETFPSAFFSNNKQVKPLQLGIFEDILEFYDRLEAPPFSKKILREAINYYSASHAYLTAQTQHTMRINLFGFEVDPVTPEQAEYAKQRLTKRQK